MGEHEGQRWRCANCGADFDAVARTTAATARACLPCSLPMALARRELLALLDARARWLFVDRMAYGWGTSHAHVLRAYRLSERWRPPFALGAWWPR